MARARNIKPSFCSNEQIAECDIWARMLFIHLWGLADREGRLEDRPLRIKAAVFPFDNCDVEKMLAQLADKSLIIRYEAGGMKLIWIPKFLLHQRPHINEAPSVLPAFSVHGEKSTDQAPTKNALNGYRNPSSLNPSSLNEESVKTSTSTEGDVDADVIKNLDWETLRPDCQKVSKAIRCRSPQDSSLVAKAVALSRIKFNADWLWDAVDAASGPKVINRCKYLHGALAKKTKKLGLDFNWLLAQIVVPPEFEAGKPRAGPTQSVRELAESFTEGGKP